MATVDDPYRIWPGVRAAVYIGAVIALTTVRFPAHDPADLADGDPDGGFLLELEQTEAALTAAAVIAVVALLVELAIRGRRRRRTRAESQTGVA